MCRTLDLGNGNFAIVCGGKYEAEHMGCKFGADYPEIAKLLSSVEHFRTFGGMTQILIMLTLLKSVDEETPQDFMRRIGAIHHALAEMFYLGLQIGRRVGEVESLERATKAPDV